VRRRLFPFLAAAALAALPRLEAHIGSPAVVFDGSAGSYPVRVIILPAPVVPGRAEINVRMLGGETGPFHVTVLPVNARAGLAGAPPADEAQAVAGEPGLYHAELWLMTSGSYSVRVAVGGPRGSGMVIVPVDSVATQRLPMAPGLEILLALLGVILFSGAVALVGAAVRECALPPGAVPSPVYRRRGYLAASVAAVVFGLALYEGRRWWNDEDRNYRVNEIFHPLPMTATLRQEGTEAVIHLNFTRNRGDTDLSLQGLIPDHGKLMHLFLIREPELDALAHLHPRRAGAHAFEVAVPPLPPGRYRLYADITTETGFAATLTTTLDLPAPPAAATAGFSDDSPPPVARDPDDSWFVGTPATPAEGDPILARTGPAAIRAGQDLNLDFALRDRDGRPVEIEPYMGMLGHAAVRRSDGSGDAPVARDGRDQRVLSLSLSAARRVPDLGAGEGGGAGRHRSLRPRRGGALRPSFFPCAFACSRPSSWRWRRARPWGPRPRPWSMWARTPIGRSCPITAIRPAGRAGGFMPSASIGTVGNSRPSGWRRRPAIPPT